MAQLTENTHAPAAIMVRNAGPAQRISPNVVDGAAATTAAAGMSCYLSIIACEMAIAIEPVKGAETTLSVWVTFSGAKAQ